MTPVKTLSLLVIGLTLLTEISTQAGGQEQLASSIREVRAETSRTSDQLKATLSALTALTKQKEGDLRPAYNTFAGEIPRTEAAAASTRTRAHWMASDGRQYFTDWQNTVKGIANSSLQKKAQKRLDKVKASYDKVEASFELAGEKFKPFLSDLTDIQKTLAIDVTPGGVKAIKGTVRSANWNHQYVDRAIQAATKEMDKMEKALSSEAR
jgi:hypothetical protein